MNEKLEGGTMGKCRDEHTVDFHHFDPPPGWGMGDLDLGENLDDKTASIVRWVVSIRTASGVNNPQLEHTLKRLPRTPGFPPTLYYEPGQGMPGATLKNRALPRLKKDLDVVKAGEVPANMSRNTAALV